jgi:hypothetical protein
MIVYFIFTRDWLQKAVKAETSLLAVRRQKKLADGSVTDMMEELVMDEAYEVMLRRLFLEAHAELISKLSVNYLIDTPTDLSSLLQEFPDFRQDRDFSLWLNVSNEWPRQYQKTLDIKMQQFLIDYVCWRWLETKSPEDALSYAQKLPGTSNQIKELLIRRTRPGKIRPTFI